MEQNSEAKTWSSVGFDSRIRSWGRSDSVAAFGCQPFGCRPGISTASGRYHSWIGMMSRLCFPCSDAGQHWSRQNPSRHPAQLPGLARVAGIRGPTRPERGPNQSSVLGHKTHRPFPTDDSIAIGIWGIYLDYYRAVCIIAWIWGCTWEDWCWTTCAFRNGFSAWH